MVGTIRPIVYGTRDETVVSPRTLHLLGSVAGGALMGALVGTLGKVLLSDVLIAKWPARVAMVMGALHIVGAARDLRFVSFPLPQSRWQVPRRWQHGWPKDRAAFVYGVLLGTNVLTRMPTLGLHLTMLWVLLIADPAIGAGTLALCGAARAFPIFLLADRKHETRIDHLVRGLEGLQPAAFMIIGLMLAVSGAWLIAVGIMRTW